MKLSIFVSALTLVTSALAGAVELPAGVPRSVDEFRQKHQYTPPSKRSHRKVFTIRASKNDHDDVSSEFYKGLKRANKGGTLHLTKGHTYVIGKPLDLTWLDNVHVHLDGEIKFTNDTGYWQKNSFTHPFQVCHPQKDSDARLTFKRTRSCSGSGEARTSRSTVTEC